MRYSNKQFWVAAACLLMLVLGASVIAEGMGEKTISGEWRYKITVVVETPEGIKTGSAVR